MSEPLTVGKPWVRDGVLRARIDGRTTHWLLYGATPDRSSDAPAAAALVAAMSQGRPLSVEGRISPTLLDGLHRVQEVLSGWHEHLHRVPIVASSYDEPGCSPGGFGLFFSGGVDAFYSLMVHEHELSHLVMVRGFDVKLGDDAMWAPIRMVGEQVAAETGLRYVEVKTNAKRVVRGTGWLMAGHGAVLASVGLALQGTVGSMLVASTRAPGDPHPCGTHPLLDPHWSTGRLKFRHDDLVERADKVDALLHYPPAMRWLRVCWRKPGLYNCGECEKCIRTMIQLHAAGGLERCETLPDRIDLAKVEALAHNGGTVRRSDPLMALCEANGMSDVADALRRSIEAHERALESAEEADSNCG